MGSAVPNTNFVSELAASLRFDDTKLPTMPEAVQYMRSAIADDSVDIGRLSKIIQNDPVLATRIIRVANSPFYKTIQQVESVNDAVMRIGLTTTQNIALVFLKDSFNAKNRLIKDRISWLWAESQHVAAIAAVLANHYGFISKDRAILGGLLSNVGALLLLTIIDQKLNTIENEQLLTILINRYAPEFGAKLLAHWSMDNELIMVAENRDHWRRQHDAPADLVDLVLLAKSCRQYDFPIEYDLPSHIGLPAYDKIESSFPKNRPLPGLIVELSGQIQQMTSMLSD